MDIELHVSGGTDFVPVSLYGNTWTELHVSCGTDFVPVSLYGNTDVDRATRVVWYWLCTGQSLWQHVDRATRVVWY